MNIIGIVFHHSSKNPTNPFLVKTYKEEDYHLTKSKLCLDNGIKLIHIFEHEVDSIDIKSVLETYIQNEISFDGIEKEYVNTRSLEITEEDVSHSVLICRPKVNFD